MQTPHLPEPNLPFLDILTPREREVFTYLILGKANKVIAMELGISMRTVETHRARIFHKMGVRNAAELVRYVYEMSNPGKPPIPC